MILRMLSIIMAIAAAYGLWWAYDELTIFRRTVFWEYRYIIFGIGSLLALSVLEYVLGWVKIKAGRSAEDR